MTLDPIPGILVPAMIAGARVAAKVLFVDPPNAYAVTITEYDVTVQGKARDGIEEWAVRHHLTFEEAHRYDDGNLYRQYVGVIEGVPFRVVSVVPGCPHGPDCDPSEEPCCNGCASGLGPCYGPGYRTVCLTHDGAR